jgi:hypothetical protein
VSKEVTVATLPPFADFFLNFVKNRIMSFGVRSALPGVLCYQDRRINNVGINIRGSQGPANPRISGLWKKELFRKLKVEIKGRKYLN